MGVFLGAWQTWLIDYKNYITILQVCLVSTDIFQLTKNNIMQVGNNTRASPFIYLCPDCARLRVWHNQSHINATHILFWQSTPPFSLICENRKKSRSSPGQWYRVTRRLSLDSPRTGRSRRCPSMCHHSLCSRLLQRASHVEAEASVVMTTPAFPNSWKDALHSVKSNKGASEEKGSLWETEVTWGGWQR